jgi:protein-S-isoprenylcysteine O-methyltransferase Ste14
MIMLLTKGLVRDPIARRKLMFWIMMVALVMLFVGTIFLSDEWVRKHPWWAIGYWAVCGWLTLTGMLLAVMDILIIRAVHRALQRKLEKEIADRRKNEEE